MKIKTSKSEILESLQIANYFISTSSTLPLLSNILFETDETGLNMIATDMDISAKIKCKIDKIEKQGKITVNKKIISLIKEFPESEILIEQDNKDNIKVQCMKSTYKIPGLPAEDFPALHLEEKKLETVKINQKTFNDMIKAVSYAALKDSTKRNLNGVFIKFEGKSVEAVATDAHRLAFYKMELKEEVKSKFEYIIPLKTITEIGKILSDDEKEMEINFYDKVIEFKINNIDIVSRVIDESYPNYKQVIPKIQDIKAVIKKDEIEKAIRRAITITNEKSKIIVLKMESNKLYISTQTQDEGEAFEELDIKYEGESIEIFYNALYMMDFLKATEADEIELSLVSSMNPGIIRALGDDNFIYVIMPIRK